MKKFTLIIFAMIVSFGFVFAGCSGATLTMPENYDQVTSNGGFVVNVGNNTYFANAYNSYKNLTTKSDNDGQGVKQFSLKRAQQENGNFVQDEEEKIKFENVVNKIGAYEASNMFVVNEYLYFTSPNVHKNDSKEEEEYNTYQFELSTLFRIKLDGSGLVEIYTTETETAKFYLTGGQNKSILIYDDNKIMQVDCWQNSTKVNVLAEEVKSAIFPYDQGLEFVDVYFTVDREETDSFTGNILKKLNLVTKETEVVNGYNNNAETITLISYNGERLFYTRTGVEARKGLYSNNFENGLNSERKQRYDTDSFKADSKIYIIEEKDDYGIEVFVFVYNNNIFMQNLSDDNDAASSKLTTESSKIAFVDNTYVYYTTENGIYRVSVLGEHNVQQVSDVKDFNAGLVDFDGRYVYFYAKATDAKTETQYLYRADTYDCDVDNIKTEIIGELLEEDLEKEETQGNEEESAD